MNSKVLSLIGLLFALPLFLMAAPGGHYPTGLIEPSEDFDLPLMDVSNLPQAALPRRMVNYLFLPPVRSQGRNNCGAFSVTYYYKTWQEAREHGWIRPSVEASPQRVMSPGFTYPLANDGYDAGANIGEVMRVICQFGCTTWARMPESAPADQYPADDVWIDAIPFRGDSYSGISLGSDAGILALKQHLASSDLAVISRPVFSDTTEVYPQEGPAIHDEVVHARGTKPWSMHAFTIIGYDDDKTYFDGSGMRSGAFVAVNSWGTGWGAVLSEVGTGGHIWFAYDYLKRENTTAYIMIDRQGYEPEVLAELDLYTLNRHQTDLTLSAVINGTTLSRPAFPTGGGSFPYDGTITLDVTELGVDSMLHTLQGRSAPIAELRSFQTRRSDDLVLGCPDLPAESFLEDSITFQAGVQAGGGEPEVTPGNGMVYTRGRAVDYDSDGLDDLAIGGTWWNEELGQWENHAYVHLAMLEGGFGTIIPLPEESAVMEWAWGDANGDGLPDLLLTSRFSPGPGTRLILNQGGRGWTDGDAGLPEYSAEFGGHAAWGDADNDGDQDILIHGTDGTGWRLEIWEQDMGGFVPHLIEISPASNAAVQLIDLDLDGRLDISAGYGLYRNLGGFQFSVWDTGWGTPAGAFVWSDFNGDGIPDRYVGQDPSLSLYQGVYYDLGFPDFGVPPSWRLNKIWNATQPILPPQTLQSTSAVASDINHDGRFDLVLAGQARYEVSSNTWRIEPLNDTFLQGADGSFSRLGLVLPEFSESALIPIDRDLDGDQDILISGYREIAMPGNQSDAWVDNACQGAGGSSGFENEPPSVPAGLEEEACSQGIVLRWANATDDHAASTGLRYLVRMGRSAGSCDVISPAGADLYRGNAGFIDLDPLPQDPGPFMLHVPKTDRPGYLLADLPDGRYCWSVCSIDPSGIRSEWSPERAFTVRDNRVLNGDVNGDNRIDVADVALCRAMARGLRTPDPAVADFNVDGVVDDHDFRIIAQFLLERGGSGYVVEAQEEIGPMGGVVACGDLEVLLPAGALSENARIGIARDAAIPAGGGGWRIDGLPAGFAGPIEVSLPVGSAPESGSVAVLQFGSLLPMFDAEHSDRFVRPVEEIRREGGRVWFRFEAPRVDDPTGRLAVDFNTLEYTSPMWVMDWDWWRRYDRSNYVLYVHRVWAVVNDPLGDHAGTLLNEIDRSLGALQKLGFSMSKLPKQKVFAYDISGIFGDSDGTILRIDVDTLSNLELLRGTLTHELMHSMQSAYGGSYYTTKTLWLAEASAVWAEALTQSTPAAYESSTYGGEASAAVKGMKWPASVWYKARRKAIANYGYGMASLIKYLADRYGSGIVKTMYDEVLSGKTPIPAIQSAVARNGGTSPRWHEDFLTDFAKRKIYPGQTPAYTVFAGSNTFNVSDDSSAYSKKGDVMGFGAQVFDYRLKRKTYEPDLEEDHVVYARIRGDDGKLSLNLLGSRNMRVLDEFKARGIPIPGKKAAYAVMEHVDDLCAGGQGASVIAVVGRHDFANPEASFPYEIEMFLARQLDEDIEIPAYQRTGDFFMGADGQFLPWPGIEGSGSIHAGPFLGESSVSGGEGFHSVYLKAFASDGIPLPVQLLTRNARLAFPLTFDQKGTRYKAEEITGYTYYKHLLSGTEPYSVPVSTETITSMDWTVRPEESAVVFQVNADLRFTLQSLDAAGMPVGTAREYTVGIPIFSVLVHRK